MTEVQIGDTVTFASKTSWWKRHLIALGLVRAPEPVRYVFVEEYLA